MKPQQFLLAKRYIHLWELKNRQNSSSYKYSHCVANRCHYSHQGHRVGNKRSQSMSWGTWCCCFLCTLTVNVVLATNTSCPTWHYYNNVTGQCKCGAGLLCTSDKHQVEIGKDHCATSLGKKGDYYIGRCPLVLTVNRTNRLYSEMPSNVSQLDEVVCGPYNRRGFLCGECKDGYGPVIYAFDLKCVNCSSHWSKLAICLYLFLQFVPTTLIFICLVVFRINITSGPLLGYILFCQVVSVNSLYTNFTHFPALLRILLLVTISQMWNLILFKVILPPFCIGEKLTGIHVRMLNLIPQTYPIILIIISCILMELHARKKCKILRILWRPFKIILSKTNIMSVTSDAVFRGFASLILLSNISVLPATVPLLTITYVCNSTNIFQRKVLYVDPTIEWPSQWSLPYAITVAVPFLFVSLIPSVLLCIYPTRLYQYLSRFLSARKRLAITAFAEALHSCFKDGLNGTRDYRALAGAPMFVLVLIAVVYNLIHFFTTYRNTDIIVIFLGMLLVGVISYIKPCKSPIANISLSFHLCLFGIVICAAYLWNTDLTVETNTIELTWIIAILTPHILVAVWAGYTLTKHTLTRCGYQFHGPGCKVALSDMANGVRLCLWGRHRGYQELDEQ